MNKEKNEKNPEQVEGQGPEVENAPVREEPPAAEAQAREFQDEKDQLYARLQRAMADLQNYQKRAIKERQETIQRTELNTIERFVLPLIDDLDRAMKAAVEHGYSKDDPLYHGVNLVLQHAFGQLKQIGIEPIDAEGKTFDPLHHEAVMELPDPSRPENTVVQVITRGYTQEGKTIRPARVVIAKSPKEASGESASYQPDGDLAKKDKE